MAAPATASSAPRITAVTAQAYELPAASELVPLSGEDDLISARVCGTPSVDFVSHTKDSRTVTGQKSVFVTIQFEGADVAEIYLNGTLLQEEAIADGAATRYTVTMELVEGENVVHVVGVETCTEPGVKGFSTFADMIIVYNPSIDPPTAPNNSPSMPDDLASTGVELLWGVVVGVALTLLAFLLMRRMRERDTAETPGPLEAP
ncbi:MAG: hypothetical protein E2601_06490 [Microbacterium sp.]|nr:hypothetical protein [Microbacterium sp.]